MGSRREAWSLRAALVLLAAGGGCASLRYTNTAGVIARHVRASHDPTWLVMFKCSVLYPARDVLTLDPLWRAVFGDEAWNAEDDAVGESPFWTARPPETLTPARVATGPCTMPPPQPPITLERRKLHGRAPGFVGRDAAGRRFLFKLDDPDWPELGTTAEFVGARILWALGYNVPPVFLTRPVGTGDRGLDGRRATAALLLGGVRGHFHFDWFRYRREVRALRLACAWINDTDRVGTNTLVVVSQGVARYYQIDFNGSLGSWQGRPKEPWRGHRYEWDLGWALLQALSLGLLHPEPRPEQPLVSPAVGRLAGTFDPLAWRSEVPNTAFDHMTAADARWIAGRIALLGRAHLEAIVAAAGLRRRQDADYLVRTLLERRARILALVPAAGAARGAAAERGPRRFRPAGASRGGARACGGGA